MVRENLLLGIASFLLASGAAVAALSDGASGYIHVRYEGDVDFTCTPITASGMGGPTVCTVTVTVNDAHQHTPAYDNQVNTTTCTLRLTGGSFERITTRRIIAVDPL